MALFLFETKLKSEFNLEIIEPGNRKYFLRIFTRAWM